MNEEWTRLSRMTMNERTSALRWLAKQAEEVRVEVMFRRFNHFHKLKKKAGELPSPEVDYCALVAACRDCGWRAQQRFRSSRALTDDEARRLAGNRLARAREGQGARAARRDRIAREWGKAVELRREGLSYRRIATYFTRDLGIPVSHTTMGKLFRAWGE